MDAFLARAPPPRTWRAIVRITCRMLCAAGASKQEGTRKGRCQSATTGGNPQSILVGAILVDASREGRKTTASPVSPPECTSKTLANWLGQTPQAAPFQSIGHYRDNQLVSCSLVPVPAQY